MSPSAAVFPFQCHSTNTPHSSSSTCCCFQKDKRVKPGNLPEIGGNRIEKKFNFVCERVNCGGGVHCAIGLFCKVPTFLKFDTGCPVQ